MYPRNSYFFWRGSHTPNKKRRQKSRNSPSLFWERRFDAIVFASSIAHARLSHENHSRHHHRRPSHFTLLCTTRRRDEDPRGPTTTTTVTTVAGIVLSSCGLPLPAERRNGCRVEDEEPPFQYSHHGSNLRTPQGDWKQRNGNPRPRRLPRLGRHQGVPGGGALQPRQSDHPYRRWVLGGSGDAHLYEEPPRCVRRKRPRRTVYIHPGIIYVRSILYIDYGMLPCRAISSGHLYIYTIYEYTINSCHHRRSYCSSCCSSRKSWSEMSYKMSWQIYR